MEGSVHYTAYTRHAVDGAASRVMCSCIHMRAATTARTPCRSLGGPGLSRRHIKTQMGEFKLASEQRLSPVNSLECTPSPSVQRSGGQRRTSIFTSTVRSTASRRRQASCGARSGSAANTLARRHSGNTAHWQPTMMMQWGMMMAGCVQR
jgi:hypothetical protein